MALADRTGMMPAFSGDDSQWKDDGPISSTYDDRDFKVGVPRPIGKDRAENVAVSRGVMQLSSARANKSYYPLTASRGAAAAALGGLIICLTALF
jgi:hypothetical protein